MDKTMELAQMLARFKLQVKRTLGETVDLERLSREPAYTRQRLSELEEMAEDEDLLIMVLRMRDMLLPADIAQVVATPAAVVAAPAAAPQKETRNYLMGARAW
jgi:hypothetical protein